MLIYVRKDLEGDAMPYIALHEGNFMIPRWATKHVEMAEREKKEKFNIPDDYQLTYITYADFLQLTENAKVLLLSVTDEGAVPQYELEPEEEEIEDDECEDCECEDEENDEIEEEEEETEDDVDEPHGKVLLYIHGSFDNDN